jgi:hypothetical protein
MLGHVWRLHAYLFDFLKALWRLLGSGGPNFRHDRDAKRETRNDVNDDEEDTLHVSVNGRL